ncbi:MAG: exodeoxyribonuclease VII large subunit [Gemmataceae bacterium]|nr:exodeoxyribonuclease VII large subunit [Gemmataceae bacterium]
MGFATVPEGVKVHSVSELTAEVKALLEEGFASVWVAGEVSNLARPSSGHLYLVLKDGQSQLRAVIWRGIALRLRFDPRDGLEVIVRGRMTVYPPRGEYQLVIEELHPRGIGAQELALRQLKQKLFELGWFDPGRKKPLPGFPSRIALVTSPTGAAVRDMLEILARRWPAAEVWVCPVRVQGEGAAQEIEAALRRVNRLGGVDVIVLGRGGGSTEDLWAFNEEIVARAIYESRIPVVSAVGHEIDVTVADLVADRRALTPSEAAELVTPNREELAEGLHVLEARLRDLMLGRLRQGRQRCQELAERPAFRLPLERVRDLERRLDDWSERLERAARQRVAQARQGIETTASRLEGLSPLNVLGRGYSLTRTEADRTVVRSPEQVRPGDRLVTLVQHGQIISRVESGQQSAVSDQPDNKLTADC